MSLVGSLFAVSLALAGATSSPQLAAGIAHYEAGDNQAALALLLTSLDAKTTRADRGRARLYIGLIQHEAGSVKDAEGSFNLALRLAPRLHLPSRASAAARKLFTDVRDALGIRPKPKKPRRQGSTTSSPPPSGPKVLAPSGPSERDTLSARSGEVSIDRNATGTTTTRSPNLTKVDSEVPMSTWIVAGAGAAAMIAAVTLAFLASSNTSRAFNGTDIDENESHYGTAETQHTAAVASFAASGVLFGAAALTLAF